MKSAISVIVAHLYTSWRNISPFSRPYSSSTASSAHCVEIVCHSQVDACVTAMFRGLGSITRPERGGRESRSFH